MPRMRLLAVAALALSLTGWARTAPCDVQADGDAAALAADPAALFEFGRCEALAGRHAPAVRAFERLLARADSPRVRLELARSLAALGRRDEALAAYRAVRDAHPPEPVDGWVVSEMAALAPAPADGADVADAASVGWTWHPRAGIGALADSNVNAGPADAAVQIFGLPFELGAASLAQRDVGAQTWLGLGAARPGAGGQWHADAQWSGTRYAHQGRFSGDTFSVQAGFAPVRSGGALDVGVALESQSQRNGNGRDSATLGAQGLQELAPAVALAWLGAAGRVHQRGVTGADGRVALGAGSLNLRHALAAGDPAWWPASVEALLGVRVLREALRDADRSHTDITPQLAVRASAGSACDGCGVTLDLARTLSRHDAEDPAFGLVRRDRLGVVSLTLARAAPASTTASEAAATWQCVIERSIGVSTLSAYTFDRTLLRCSREWLF